MCGVREKILTFFETNQVFLESSVFVVDLFGKFFAQLNLGIEDRCSGLKQVLQLMDDSFKVFSLVSVCFIGSSTSKDVVLMSLLRSPDREDSFKS